MNGNTELFPRHAASLAAVLERIGAACRAAGRAPESVALLAVSKTFAADHVIALAQAGQRAFGENYVPESLAKIESCADQRPDLFARWPKAGVCAWHFVGPIQSNKTRAIAEHFDWVHSVDREKIARRLSEQRPPTLPLLEVCVQVNISAEASKSGCPPEQAPALALRIATMPGLRLRGLMAIPAPDEQHSAQRRSFAALRQLFEQCRRDLAALPGEAGVHFDTLSMGMSDDLEAAIAEGATIVRVGSALFGKRARGPQTLA